MKAVLVLALALLVCVVSVQAQFKEPSKIDAVRPNNGGLAMYFPGQEESIKTADFDGDGDIDVCMCPRDHYNDQCAIFVNTDGQGTFSQYNIPGTENTHGQSHTCQPIDLNTDGHMDVIIYGSGNSVYRSYNNGDGTFSTMTTMFSGAIGTYGTVDMKVRDMNGDGMDDVLFAGSGSHGRYYWSYNPGASQSWVLGTFASQQDPYRNLAEIDINNDGCLDTVVITSGMSYGHIKDNLISSLAQAGTCEKVLQRGENRHHLQSGGYSIDGIWDINAADYNQDGITDLVWSANNHPVVLTEVPSAKGGWNNVGEMSGLDASVIAQGGWRFQGADFNNDGAPDLALWSWKAPCMVHLLTNNKDGSGTFTRVDFDLSGANCFTGSVDYEWSVGAEMAFEFADIDGDGMVDMIFGGRNGIYWYKSALLPTITMGTTASGETVKCTDGACEVLDTASGRFVADDSISESDIQNVSPPASATEWTSVPGSDTQFKMDADGNFQMRAADGTVTTTRSAC